MQLSGQCVSGAVRSLLLVCVAIAMCYIVLFNLLSVEALPIVVWKSKNIAKCGTAVLNTMYKSRKSPLIYPFPDPFDICRDVCFFSPFVARKTCAHR